MIKNCLVVEDHQLFARGIAETLSVISPGMRTVLLDNESGAIRMLDGGGFDLVIADIFLDGHSPAGGMRVIRRAKSKDEKCLCVGMSSDASPILLRNMRAYGANHFFHKIITESQFFDFFERLLHGDRNLPFCFPSSLEIDHVLDMLTLAELRVSRLLVAGGSNREIADALVLSENTVKKYIQSIYQKTDCASRTEFASRFMGDLKHLSHGFDE